MKKYVKKCTSQTTQVHTQEWALLQLRLPYTMATATTIDSMASLSSNINATRLLGRSHHYLRCSDLVDVIALTDRHVGGILDVNKSELSVDV